MKRILAIAAFCIIHTLAYSQVNTDIKPVIKTKIVIKRSDEPGMNIDTNKLAVDEKGNKLRYYQYMPLVRSGQYAISTRGVNGPLADEYRLMKSTLLQNPELLENFSKQIAIKSTLLELGNVLTVKPLKQIDPSKFDNKAIVLMFLSTDCEPCMVDIPHLGDVLKKGDPNKMTLVAVARTHGSPKEGMDQLRALLPNAYIYVNESDIYESYWVNDITNGYVITDKNHIIRFTSKGQGGIVPTMFKAKLQEVLK